MPDPATPETAAENVALPLVAPLGGSKWAGFYAGPTSMRVVEPAMTVTENGLIHADGRVLSAQGAAQAGDGNMVFALEAGEAVSLGQFLTGPLNIALQLPAGHRLAGPVLTPRQTDVLSRLGSLRDYTPVRAPRSFGKIMSVAIAPGMSLGALTRAAPDQLRPPYKPPGMPIAVLPVRQYERFCLINRASLTAWLRAKRFTIVEPERLKLTEILDLFAAAPLVLLADPRQAGLLGLCHPGTKILEIAPEGWLSATGHYLSTLFGLAWQPFLAGPPSYSLRSTLPFGSLVPCGYEISIRELATALPAFTHS